VPVPVTGGATASEADSAKEVTRVVCEGVG
jgi:hypothetical protein